MNRYEKGTFGYDLQYLSEKENDLHVLTGNDAQAQVIVSTRYQGKVFTSTAEGLAGKSLGFVNYKAFEAGESNEHIHAYGGENRLWTGPEGGRFSVFFQPGSAQIYDHWHTPKPLDTEPWQRLSADKQKILMEKEMHVSNYIGSRLHLKIRRKVTLLETAQIASQLGITLNERIKTVAYATENTLTNLNDFAWTPNSGTVCLWMLDMFCTGPRAFTIVPYVQGNNDELGIVAITTYFGEIPPGRYKEKDGCIFLTTDGQYRSKIGLNRKRTKGIAGNYNPDSHHLTVVTFDIDRNAIYLNQEWDAEKDPLTGDVFNAYNDGPLDDGSIMGPFLELESSSPAALIAPGESLVHHHNVFHFTGEETALNTIAQALFGTSIITRNAYFASGCFWGTEYYFMKAAGVTSTAVGFMGGHLPNPTYKQVCTGKTGHLECVEVTYDATKTSYEDLLKLFFETHDFTQTNGQGPDIGPQYLSCIFYRDNEEKEVAEKYIALLQKQDYRVATQLTPASSFWKAEDYHQQYYEHKGERPYCHSYKKIF